MRELWSREDEQDLAEFLDAVRRSDLVGAMFSIEGRPPAARRPAEAVLDAGGGGARPRAAGPLADPFAGGVPLTVDDCRRKVKSLAGGRVPWRAEYLRQMEIPALLERVLRNLSGCRGRTG